MLADTATVWKVLGRYGQENTLMPDFVKFPVLGNRGLPPLLGIYTRSY